MEEWKEVIFKKNLAAFTRPVNEYQIIFKEMKIFKYFFNF